MSNASRTQLMNLKTLAWDDDMIRIFGLERSMLAPEILPTDGEFGFWKGVPITGVLGDSHATLFGQGCVHPGDTKVSYGTGSSVMMNMGQTPAICPDGSLTTAVAFHYGGRVHYQTEGNITCSCDTLVWLCREMAWFRDEAEIEAMAATVPDAGGVQLVPALSGLGAPYFDGDARGVLCGLSRGSTRAHVARAALEGIAQRCADVTEAMAAFCGSAPALLAADGGGAKNALMMQAQADSGGLPGALRGSRGAFRPGGGVYGRAEDGAVCFAGGNSCPAGRRQGIRPPDGPGKTGGNAPGLETGRGPGTIEIKTKDGGKSTCPPLA